MCLLFHAYPFHLSQMLGSNPIEKQICFPASILPDFEVRGF